MRVFYIDEDDKQSKPRYYVKVDNIDVPDPLKGFKAFDAETTKELKEEIMKYYKFNKDIRIQLWTSSGYSGKRLDELPSIPKEYEFLWLRAVLNK